ncbi:hypothetical protein MKZ38_001388 [Zalerion maritima]|uniref:Uncharacterized protein n=1 Tax=Zalerion maritima TaxID=339359 RepID=A0AAD5RR81_9PEZI|nr:hypothetical protein MKZ38_001388 [Zalerion maritima]
MLDALRPSAEDFRAVYEKDFRTWFSLYRRAADEHNLPPHWLDVAPIFRRQPCFPRDLELKLVKFKYPNNHSRLYATGTSTWETSQGSCKMPLFEQTFDIPVPLGKPTSVLY